MKTPCWKKWICILSNFIASILSRSICQTCATIPGVEFLSMFKKWKENLSAYVHVLHKTSRKEVHIVVGHWTSKKCTNVWSKSRATSFPWFSISLFPGERTLVAASHVEMCVNKLRSGGRSSTKFCPLDNEILSGVGTKFLLPNSARVSELPANCVAFS